jgi:hypothetical protein
METARMIVWFLKYTLFAIVALVYIYALVRLICKAIYRSAEERRKGS